MEYFIDRHRLWLFLHTEYFVYLRCIHAVSLSMISVILYPCNIYGQIFLSLFGIWNQGLLSLGNARILLELGIPHSSQSSADPSQSLPILRPSRGSSFPAPSQTGAGPGAFVVQLIPAGNLGGISARHSANGNC